MVGRLRLLRFLINNKGSFAVGIKAEKRKSLRELPNDDERLSLHKISIFRQLPYKWYKINKKRKKDTRSTKLVVFKTIHSATNITLKRIEKCFDSGFFIG